MRDEIKNILAWLVIAALCGIGQLLPTDGLVILARGFLLALGISCGYIALMFAIEDGVITRMLATIAKGIEWIQQRL